MSTAQQSLIEKCLLHTLEVVKTSSAPISRQKLFNDFMEKEGIQRSRTFLNNKILEMLAVLASMKGVTVEDKAKWMFVTSTPFTASKEKRDQKFNEGLQKLKNDIEHSGVAVWNDRGQIIKYSDKDGVVKFEGVHCPRTGTAGRKQAKKASKAPELVALSDMENESEDEDVESSKDKAKNTAKPSRAAPKTLVKVTRNSASKSRKLIETSSDDSDEEGIGSTQNSSQEKSKKAPLKRRSAPKTQVNKTSKTAPKSKEFIETSSDESDVDDVLPAPKTPSSNERKRSIDTSNDQENTAVTDEAVEQASNEVQNENFDPADTQPEQRSLQGSPEEPSAKRMCVDIDNDEVLERIANIKPEIDDDIIFEGIVAKEDKRVDTSRILPFRPSILGGMSQYPEEFEEEEIRNIHSLGFLNCLKDFLEGVMGRCNVKAAEIQKDIARLIQKVELDSTFMAWDAKRLTAIVDDLLGRLVLQTTNKEHASESDQLNFLMVLEQLKKSCDTKMTAELAEEVNELIEGQIDDSESMKELISGDSILEVMRRMMLDIKY
ncbi:hypothetical protein CAEBREN_08776 [Caenorhabditis brenneri]|uniref:SPK domain-containing protein n=1 Tax=Caenorhabditis brenneri TaxID=135651 RepID=G0NDQ2_CAEBE|nr:hypothetical protein CAEBREN_08776 [Caenorhabditis brenneri]